MTCGDGFLQLTANDYDMEFEDVKRIYNQNNNSRHAASFYENLELFIKNRANK